MGGTERCAAANEDIDNFLFAIAPPRKLQWNLSLRKWCLLPETALARHRTIGGHAGCPRIALRERQFLGHFGAGPKEDLVRCLPTERWIAVSAIAGSKMFGWLPELESIRVRVSREGRTTANCTAAAQRSRSCWS